MEERNKTNASFSPAPAPGSLARLWKGWIEPILYAVVLVTLFKTFFFQNYRIPSSSMEDTLLIGDYLFAAKFLYGTHIPFTKRIIWKIRDPRPGDIVIFKSVEKNAKDPLIKRVIAVGGQTVEVKNARVLVDGVEQRLPDHSKDLDPVIYPADVNPRDNMGPVTVPDGMLFMMGDNRDNSYDSRFWGLLPEQNVLGKALFIYWSSNPGPFRFDFWRNMRWSRILNKIR